MADEPTIAAVSTPAAAASPAAAVASPAPVAPSVDAAPAAPSAAPVVAEATPVAAVTPEAPAADAKPDDEVPVETAPVEASAEVAAPVEEKPADAPVEPKADAAPKPFEFKIPETVKADAATLSAYNNVLGKYGISQEAGQELLDFHANAIKATADQISKHQVDTWDQTNAKWIAEFEQSAGNRRDTILNDAKFAITDTIKDAKVRKEVWDVLAFTGAGNNKAVINFMAAMGKRLRERSAPSPSASVNGARAGSPAERRYGGTNKTQG